MQARTQNAQVTPYMAGPSGYNPEQFGPITDRPVHHAGPSGYVADRSPSYVGPSGYGMNRPTYYAGPSDSTRVHAQTTQVTPYMTDPSGYSPGPFGPITDRLVLYGRRSGYETTQVAPYTAGQSGYTFRPFGQVTDHPASYVGPSRYAYTEPRAAQYAQFPNSSQQHYGAPPATHYSHTIPPHGHRAEYCSSTREPERYRAGAGDINRTHNTHLKHPWEESRQSDVRQPEISTHKLNGWSPDMAERIRDEVAGMFRDKLGVSVSGTGQSYQKPYSHRFDTVLYPQGTRIPDFSKFSGEGGKSTHEHISQFIAHLGELADGEAYRVRLFSLSLTDTAFAWYAALPPNSINSWEELEQKFHEHFFSREHELELADLASVRQGPEESVNDYIWRFRDTRNRCFQIHVTEKQLTGLAFNGCDPT
jgi:hypothetical protein